MNCETGILVLDKISVKTYKNWIKEALDDNIVGEELISWIEDNFNVNIDGSQIMFIRSLYLKMDMLRDSKKRRKVRKEIKKEAKEDPRFQMLANEIDELKEEIKVLKKLCFEKTVKE